MDQEEYQKKVLQRLETIEFLLGSLFIIGILAIAGAIFQALGVLHIFG